MYSYWYCLFFRHFVQGVWVFVCVVYIYKLIISMCSILRCINGHFDISLHTAATKYIYIYILSLCCTWFTHGKCDSGQLRFVENKKQRYTPKSRQMNRRLLHKLKYKTKQLNHDGIYEWIICSIFYALRTFCPAIRNFVEIFPLFFIRNWKLCTIIWV